MPTGASKTRRSTSRARWKMPWFAVSFILGILLCNAHIFMGTPPSALWRACLCDRSAVQGGEFWRLVLCAFPHDGLQHLLEDVAYLAVVGTLVERMSGTVFVATAFLLCVIAGAGAFTLWDHRHAYLLGSSDGTHGLLACMSTLMLLSTASLALRAVCSVAIAYLLYTSIHAIFYGVMAWPLAMLPNGGYDHLGGVTMGILAGVILHLHTRRKPDSGKQKEDSRATTT